MSNLKLPKATLPDRTGTHANLTEAAMQRWNPAVSAQSVENNSRTISILDPIGEGMFYEGVTAKRVAAALRNMGKGPVTVLINSPGGDFFEGLAIYNLLVDHDGAVTVKILSVAASAASAIAMAGDEILIARAAFFMIHNTHVGAYGDAGDFGDVAAWLQPFDKTLRGLYAARTDLSDKDLKAMMDAKTAVGSGTWLDAETSVQKGFATAVLNSDDVALETSPSAKSAQKKIDAFMARLNIPRSERRSLVAALKGGMPNAVPNDMPSAVGKGDTQNAVIAAGASALLKKLENI